MNPFAHIFLNYFFFSLAIPDINKYTLPIILFAIMPDLDHIPGYIIILMMPKRKRSRLEMDDYTGLFRTVLQEPLSLIIIEFILATSLVWTVRKSTVQ